MAEDPSLAASVRDLATQLAPAEALRAAAEGFAVRSRGAARPGARRARRRRARARPPRSADRGRGVRAAAAGRRTRSSSRATSGRRRSRSSSSGEGRIVGVALAEGSATAHAAIVARSLGLPMAVALGADLAAIARRHGARPRRGGGRRLGRSGDTRSSRRRGSRCARACAAAARSPDCAACRPRRSTAAGSRSSATPRRRRRSTQGLAAGAAGVGLLRTELAFLEAPAWPTEQQHRAALAPLLAPLRGRVATVRTLDFGADKTPPFLDRTPERGLTLMLDAAGRARRAAARDRPLRAPGRGCGSSCRSSSRRSRFASCGRCSATRSARSTRSSSER